MPAEEITVEAELLEVTGVRKNKDRQIMLEKICEAVSTLEDDDWSGLSPEAQKWYARAAKAYKAEQDLPDFQKAQEGVRTTDDESGEESEARKRGSDDGGDSAVDDGGDATEQENDDMPSTNKKTSARPAKKVSAKSAPTSKKVASAPRRGGEPRKSGSAIRTAVKQIMMKSPTASAEDIFEKLKDRGLKCSKLTIDTVRTEFRHSLRFLNDGDYLRKRIEL